MLGGFVMAGEAGIVDAVLKLPIRADGHSLPMRNLGAVTAVLFRGQDAKAAIVGMG